MTIKQKQCLLAYLGYYVGAIDGAWGTLSKTALRAFQADFGGIAVDGICGQETEKALRHAVAYGMPVREAQEEATNGDFWDDIEFFTREEFKCKCGGKYCDGYPAEPDETLVKLLEQIRKHFGTPVTVTSGIRCSAHNANVGGASASQHLQGTAADIQLKGIQPDDVAAYVETLMPNAGGIGVYSTFIHVDVRAAKSRWSG